MRQVGCQLGFQVLERFVHFLLIGQLYAVRIRCGDGEGDVEVGEQIPDVVDDFDDTPSSEY